MKKTILALLLAALLFAVSCGNGTHAVSDTAETSGREEPQSVSADADLSGTSEDGPREETGSGPDAEESAADGITVFPELFRLAETKEPFDIHTPDQRDYLNGPYEQIARYADGWHECSKPRTITLQWEYMSDLAPEGAEIPEGFTVLLDVSEDFFAPRTSYVPYDGETTMSVGFTNLYIDSSYYWKVRASCGDTEYESGVSVFCTSPYAPRNLSVDGVSNVRDVGGRQIDGTHRLKQGMIYRGAAFEDTNYETHITEEGIRTVRETLGVKTEIELRWISMKEIPSRSSSLLGEDIRYYEFEFSYNDEELLEGNAKSIARCFRIFADKNKYPVYYHCRIGTDRTGVLTYLLLGYLGVDKDTLIQDYLFSNFGYVGGNRQLSSIQKAYIDVIDSYEGETLAEKITYFLKKKCKLNEVTLEKIKAIMIEES